ncbi:MAG: hypothetical protein JRD05_11000 [Deltaproteobacteria bacterium]|nr:hypothetical protein [Deltaproteobacteria bacterium]
MSYRGQDTRFWILDAGYSIFVARYLILDTRCSILVAGFLTSIQYRASSIQHPVSRKV